MNLAKTILQSTPLVESMRWPTMWFHRRCSAALSWVEGAQLVLVLEPISARAPAPLTWRDLLPGKERPKASSANTLLAGRAAQAFLVESLDCSDKVSVEEIRSSCLMPESRKEFPPRGDGRSWERLLEQAGRGIA